MTQQINLFNPDFVPRRELFTARHFIVGVVAALLVAVGGSAWAYWRQATLAREEARLANEVNVLRQQADALSAQVQARRVDAGLERQVSDTRALIAGRKQVVEWLRSEGLRNSEGVSEYMRAFARQTMTGVWLTGFHVGSEGRSLRIEGRAVKGDLVPQYLARLGSEAVLSGRDFTKVAMGGIASGSSEATSAYLSFTLETAKDAETSAQVQAR